MLKLSYSTEAEIPAEHKALYKQENGKFILQVEGGAVAMSEFVSLKNDMKSKLDSAYSERDTAKSELKKFDGIDPVKAKTIPPTIDAAVQEALRPLQQKVSELELANKQAAKEIETGIIQTGLLSLLPKYKVRGDAVEDVTSRASKIWKVEDKKLVAKDSNGAPVLDSSGKPLTPEGWLQSLPKHLFEPSSGGGASGSGTGGSGAAVNPWKKDQINYTQQAELMRADPTKAAALKAEAGVK